jgi:hypothetical protein
MSDERLWGGGSPKKPQSGPPLSAPETERDFLNAEDPQGYEEPYILPPLRPDRQYVAFRLGKRRERLRIDRATQPMRFPAYCYLVDIKFDSSQQIGFVMYFTSMTVEVLGKNLWPVVHAISSGRCEAIHEYHSKIYDAPPKGAPIIESIKLTPPEALADD